MDFYLSLLIYFLVGIISDFVVTLNWRYVAKDKTFPAVASSFIATLIGWLVFYNILTGLDSEKSILAIIIYSLGVAAGTFWGMKFKVGFKG